MEGIDVSSNNVNLNWETVKGKKVCYVKATEGVTYTNPYMSSQITKARSLGMSIGLYHKLRGNNALTECKHFLDVVKPYKSDCLYMIDAETEPVGMSARIRAFSNYLTTQNKPSILYTGLYFYNTEVLPIARNIPLWIAKYGGSRPTTVKSIAWQYNGTGLDLSIFDNGILLPVPKVTVKVVPKVAPKIIAITYPRHQVINCDSLCVRNGNGEQYKEIDQFKRNAAVVVNKVDGHGWSNIQYNVWVKSSFLK